MSLIRVQDLTFAYEGSYDNIFEHVSVRLDTDWRLGLTGRNGRGKTTFLRLLCGEYEYHGSIAAGVDFAYFPYEVPDRSLETGVVMERLCPSAADWERERELSRLAVGEDALRRPFGTLSGGERTKVLLAALFLGENRFPLIDEPTNHLDLRGREMVSRYLRGKKGFILVSHDRAFLDGCIDHVMSINRTSVEVRQGNFSEWFADKQRRDRYETEQDAKLKREISRLSQAAARTSGWSAKVEKSKYAAPDSGLKVDRGYVGHKSAKMMRRAKAIETRQKEAVEAKRGLLKEIESAEPLKLAQEKYHSRRLILAERVSVLYDGKASGQPVSFTVEQGDRVALSGANGCGKSSILKLACGEPLRYAGNFQRASGLRISYVPQDTSALRGNLSNYAAAHGIDESLFKAILRKLDFSRVQFEKDMADFSEGQKKKVALARSLCERSHLLLWDEPLNYVDVLSRIQLEELLLRDAPTILFVEHDRAFLDDVATKIITF